MPYKLYQRMTIYMLNIIYSAPTPVSSVQIPVFLVCTGNQLDRCCENTG
jgi:hypothetical protein